jgi:Beta propeller domain
MRPRTTPTALLLIAAVFAFSYTRAASPQEQGALESFGSEQELEDYLRQLQQPAPGHPAPGGEPGTELDAPGSSPCEPGACLEEVMVTGARASMTAYNSITNSQHAGVDEGGIVKQHGDHLVVLRRGRLFTVDVSGPRLKPVSSINAYGPDMDPSGTWYDEMLISDDKIVVIGYSYERGGTEIGLFHINKNGGLRYRGTYHFRSYDYYSSRNYASRLIGSKLILYAPLNLRNGSDNPLGVLPAIRKWHAGAEDEAFKPITSARRIYRGPVSNVPARNAVLHSVTVCNLARVEMQCQATGVIGSWGRVFYVSPKAMYVWSSREWRPPTVGAIDPPVHSTLFRMPLDGSEPGAIRVLGEPVDQFSFEESRDGYLNVLVRAETGGDAMWSAERTEGSVALLRLATRLFRDGSQVAPDSAYRELPRPTDDNTFHNRFVGNFLLYGTGEGWWDQSTDSTMKVYVVNVKTGRVSALTLTHGIDRIEPMASNAVVVGESNNEDLHFTAIRLAGSGAPALAQRHVLKGASQGELRSHGFFYRPDGRGGGVLGLPVRNPAAPGYEHLFDESAGVVFIRNQSSQFHELGQLRARDEGAQDDDCQASCVDWYGNSRPVFIEDRIFALMGYELVEGTMKRGGIQEVRRVNFAPKVMTADID